MKKVCILSMQKVQNFGSLLQSYSLKKVLESLGAEVHFIDIEKKEQDDKLVENARLHFHDEIEKNKGIFSKLKKIDKYTINRLRIKKIAEQQNLLFEEFRKNVLNIRKEDNEEKYDLCVIGSDEVFNCMSPSEWGFTSQLFGNVRQAETVVLYAASCGATKYEQLNSEMKKIIQNAFENVKGFSARDNNTKEFIEHFRPDQVESHMDPVWIGDFQEQINDAEITVDLPSKFCVIYSYYNRIHDNKEIETILRFCKENEMEPIALGAPQMWLKKYFAVSPFEMLKIFQKADFIITDTFHGTIFSQKFNGKFAVLYRESNKNKLTDLVNKINAEMHVVSTFSELNLAYDAVTNKEEVLENVFKQRQQSLDYLKEYIKKK